MADFLSRIFAIPSDSSTTSDEDVGAATTSRSSDRTPLSSSLTKKRGHSRTLTPLSAGEDGATGSASQGASAGNSGTAASESSVSAESNGRGRQHRDEHAHRSASTSQRRSQKLKPSHRSSSASQLTDMNQTGGKTHKSRRSLSRLGKRAKPKESLARANSWSSAESSHEQLLLTKDTNDRPSPAPSYQHKNSIESSNATNNNDNAPPYHSADAPKKSKKKDWRYKFTGGMKKTSKHLSPGTATATATHTPPTPTDAKKGSPKPSSHPNKVNQQNNRNRENKNHLESTRLHIPQRKPPINVGDSIIISQQFLEESMEISVVTLPRELAMKEDGIVFDGEAKAQQDVGQKRVMGNDLVRAFLDRQKQGPHKQPLQSTRQRRQFKGGYMDRLEEVGSGLEDNNDVSGDENGGIPAIPTVGSGGLYERISAYASRLLEEGSIYHNQSQSRDHGEEVEEGGGGEEGIEVQHLNGLVTDESDRGASKHTWPCDPTADGYSHHGNDAVTGVPLAFPPPPPPEHPPAQSRTYSTHTGAPPRLHRGATNLLKNVNSIDDSPGVDPVGELLASPTAFNSQSFESVGDQNETSDPLGSFLDAIPRGNPPPKSQPELPVNSRSQKEENVKPVKAHKAVTFCLPSTHHPPAPPFMGPPMDYYYSMERGNDEVPLWSSSNLMPPIIELWSPVENSEFDPSVIDGNNAWDDHRENGLVGERRRLEVSKEWIDVSAAIDHATNSSAHHLSAVREESPTLNNEFFDDVLDCDEGMDVGMDVTDIDAEMEQLRIDPSGDSYEINSSHNNQITASCPPNDTLDDVNTRHRSSWRSSHNLSYKPPTYNNGSPDKALQQSRSSDELTPQDDPSLNNRNEQENSDRLGTMHGRLLRARRLVASSNKQRSNFSRSLSRSSSSLGSHSSSPAAMASAAIAIQSSVRGYITRQFFHQMFHSTLIIQREVRAFLLRKRYREEHKLRLSYFPNQWKKRNSQIYNF